MKHLDFNTIIVILSNIVAIGIFIGFLKAELKYIRRDLETICKRVEEKIKEYDDVSDKVIKIEAKCDERYHKWDGHERRAVNV